MQKASHSMCRRKKIGQVFKFDLYKDLFLRHVDLEYFLKKYGKLF